MYIHVKDVELHESKVHVSKMTHSLAPLLLPARAIHVAAT